MIELFRKYKPFLLFLGKFFVSYGVLVLVYRLFFIQSGSTIDFFTENVSLSTEQIAQNLGMDYVVKKDVSQYQVFYNEKYIARIIEGCNAVSVIILFVAFVIAFSGKWKTTFLFALVGSLLIYFFNILRIVFLIHLIDVYPAQEHFWHGVLFPLVIYGFVFLLWVYWVNKYSHYASH